MRYWNYNRLQNKEQCKWFLPEIVACQGEIDPKDSQREEWRRGQRLVQGFCECNCGI